MSAPLRRDYRHAITGAKLPGSTDLVDLLGTSKDGLLWAAHKLAQQGLCFRTEWDEKAATGTLAHTFIEQRLRGEELVAPEDTPTERRVKAGLALQAWEDWRAFKTIEPISIETPLVSSLYGYGATHDLVARIDGRVTLTDWKTGKLHDEHVIQLQLNRALWETTSPIKIERGLLVRCPTDGSPAVEVEIPLSLLDASTPVCLALLVLKDTLPKIKLPKESA